MVSRITAWARLTMTSIEGVSANIAKARSTISCRVGNCGKLKTCDYVRRAILSFGKLLLEARKIRSGKSLRNGIDRGLQIKASGELRGRAFDDPRAETVLIAANFERRRLQIPYQTS
jgi:hypothetical protein